MKKVISFQESLRPALPRVLNCKDYEDEKKLLERVNQILISSKLEEAFLAACVEEYEKRAAEDEKANGEALKAGGGGIERYLLRSQKALRCTILKHLLGESYRDLSTLLAMVPLYQDFCRIDHFDVVRPPGKSTLQSYASWLPAEKMEGILGKLTESLGDWERAREIGLENELDLATAWVDSTCLKANIHFPTDWVLLRDAVRTLIKSIVVIRKHGLVHRIGEPSELLSQVNTICMAMSAASRRKAGGKKERKKWLRVLKSVSKVIENHGRRYREMLDQEWENTDLSRKEAEVILRRMDNVLDQLPEARRQAHERIIGERQVNNAEKILSLYEPDIHVIVRRKAGANVEFGNSLFLAENADGFIIDHELRRDASPGDAKWLAERYQSLKEKTGDQLCGVVGDRGFHSKANSKLLNEDETFDGLCPKNPRKLSERLQEDEVFAAATRRRSQTEGRIGILKNAFLDGTPRAKGFENRQLQVAWAVLAHNLWVAARLPWKVDQEKLPLAA